MISLAHDTFGGENVANVQRPIPRGEVAAAVVILTNAHVKVSADRRVLLHIGGRHVGVGKLLSSLGARRRLGRESSSAFARPPPLAEALTAALAARLGVLSLDRTR